MPNLACEIADHETQVVAPVARNNVSRAIGRPSDRRQNLVENKIGRVRNFDTLVSQLCSLQEILEDSLTANPYGLAPEEVEECATQVMLVIVRSRVSPSTEAELSKLLSSMRKQLRQANAKPLKPGFQYAGS